jgi:hypothetical protein
MRQIIEGKAVEQSTPSTCIVSLVRQPTGETLESLTIQIMELWRSVEGDLRLIGGWLLEIRDHKLWHPKYSSFKEYCEKELPFGRRRAYQVIEAETVMLELPDGVNHGSLNERLLRELSQVPAGKRAEVLAKATELAEREGEALTARHIMLARGRCNFAVLAAQKPLETKERIQARKLCDAWRRACNKVRRDFMIALARKSDFKSVATMVLEDDGLLARE